MHVAAEARGQGVGKTDPRPPDRRGPRPGRHPGQPRDRFDGGLPACAVDVRGGRIRLLRTVRRLPREHVQHLHGAPAAPLRSRRACVQAVPARVRTTSLPVASFRRHPPMPLHCPLEWVDRVDVRRRPHRARPARRRHAAAVPRPGRRGRCWNGTPSACALTGSSRSARSPGSSRCQTASRSCRPSRRGGAGAASRAHAGPPIRSTAPSAPPSGSAARARSVEAVALQHDVGGAELDQPPALRLAARRRDHPHTGSAGELQAGKADRRTSHRAAAASPPPPCPGARASQRRSRTSRAARRARPTAGWYRG